METDSFIVYIKKDDIYKDIAEGLETRFDIQNMNQNAIPLINRYQKEKIRK